MRGDKAGWPIGAMLAYGTFGGGHPAAHKYHVRSAIALAGLRGLDDVRSSRAWEFRRYLLSIDELARSLQSESIAWLA